MIRHVGRSFVKVMSKIAFVGHDEAAALPVSLVWPEKTISLSNIINLFHSLIINIFDTWEFSHFSQDNSGSRHCLSWLFFNNKIQDEHKKFIG